MGQETGVKLAGRKREQVERMVTSVPGWRDARRGEPNLWFRPLKSLLRKSIKIRSMCHCSPAISPWETSLHREITAVLVMLSIVLLTPSIAALAVPLLSYDYRRLFEFRSTRGKFY